MDRSKIFEIVNEVFRDLFVDDSLIIEDQTSAADVEGWDSLKHISLIEAIEEEFDIRFKMPEVTGMKNVGEMVSIIEERIKAGGQTK